MAQYQHLPIYKTVYELLQLVVQLTAHFLLAHSMGDALQNNPRSLSA